MKINIICSQCSSEFMCEEEEADKKDVLCENCRENQDFLESL